MKVENRNQKITLVQPNKVTNARHRYNERQENILTLIIDATQQHMTREKHIETDLFGSPMVAIDLTKHKLSGNMIAYHQAAKDMMKIDFEFEWTTPENKKEDVNGVLITTVRKVKGSSVIELTINPWAIPYLLYWGKDVGGTVFNKMVALTIRGEYPKRMYKLCKRWEDRGGFTMSVDEFRTIMCLEDKYKGTKELKKLLKRCEIRLKEDADVYFKFEFAKVGGSRSYNMINFIVVGNNKKRKKEHKTDMYSRVYSILCLAYPVMKSSKAVLVADKLADKPENLERFYYRTKRLKEDLDSGAKTITDVVKLVKYIVKNDYDIH